MKTKLADLKGFIPLKKSLIQTLINDIMSLCDVEKEEAETVIDPNTALQTAKGPRKMNFILQIDKENSNKNRVLYIFFGDKIKAEIFPFYIPHLKLLHRCPGLLKKIVIDKGAAKAVGKGADVMIPGILLEKCDECVQNQAVGVYCDGLETAIAVGYLSLSIELMKKCETGIGVNIIFRLGDNFWY